MSAVPTAVPRFNISCSFTILYGGPAPIYDRHDRASFISPIRLMRSPLR